MARWRLACPHYLNLVEQDKWEYSELDRTTGRQKKKTFLVPTLLDTNNPADFNVTNGKDDGMIVVSNNGAENAIQFKGDPTPDMIPLDDDAKRISLEFEKAGKWKAPDLDTNRDYGQLLVDKLDIEMAKIQSQPQKTEVAGMSELLGALAVMMKQNQEILNSIAGKPDRRI